MNDSFSFLLLFILLYYFIRIWDYVHDTFVHVDPLSEFSPQTLSSLTTTSPESSASFPSTDKPYSIYPLSASTNTLFPLYPQDEHSFQTKEKNEDSSMFLSSLSETANGKLRNLQKEYEVSSIIIFTLLLFILILIIFFMNIFGIRIY